MITLQLALLLLSRSFVCVCGGRGIYPGSPLQNETLGKIFKGAIVTYHGFRSGNGLIWVENQLTTDILGGRGGREEANHLRYIADWSRHYLELSS